MKIWKAYGSEHSMNLVMIGHFKDAGAAEAAKDVLEELQQHFTENEPNGRTYSEETIDLLSKVKTLSLGPSELEQFRYDFSVKVTQEKLTINTDEVEVSALWKVLIDRDAKVEIFSAHTHSETGGK